MELDHKRLGNTLALSAGKQIASIINVLNYHLKISHFCYIRSFLDGTHLLLSNDSQWIETFYLNFYDDGAFHNIPANYQSGFVLWSTVHNQVTFNACRENFNIAHGITIIENKKDYCEFYCFGTTKDNPGIANFYLSNLDLLSRFNAFFKEQANLLIEKAYADRVILPHCHSVSEETVSLEDPNAINLRRAFLNAISCRRYYLDGIYSDVYVTARELDCLNLITLGKSTKQISSVLDLSSRTVETHLNAIKKKLNVATKAGLIKKSLEYNPYKPNKEKDFFSNINI